MRKTISWFSELPFPAQRGIILIIAIITAAILYFAAVDLMGFKLL
jgi:hypothetical protein